MWVSGYSDGDWGKGECPMIGCDTVSITKEIRWALNDENPTERCWKTKQHRIGQSWVIFLKSNFVQYIIE